MSHLQVIINAGLVPRMMQFLQDEDTRVLGAAAHAVTNLVSGEDQQSREILEIFQDFLGHKEKKVWKSTLHAIQQIVHKSVDNIRAVLNTDIIPLVISHIHFVR